MMVVNEQRRDGAAGAAHGRRDAAPAVPQVARHDVDRVVDADAEGDREGDEVDEVDLDAEPMLSASSHSTPTISDPITNGVARPRRNSSSTVSTTPANARPDASGPSCSIDAMMSADSAGPPATRAGRPPSATGACGRGAQLAARRRDRLAAPPGGRPGWDRPAPRAPPSRRARAGRASARRAPRRRMLDACRFAAGALGRPIRRSSFVAIARRHAGRGRWRSACAG